MTPESQGDALDTGQMPDDLEPVTEAGRDLTAFQTWREDGGFWSTFGYDGLSLVFDVPLTEVQELPEAKRVALFRLMVYLADTPNDPPQAQVQALAELAELPAEQRLAALLDLSARLGG
jgi:hypothetical protein